MLIYGYKWCIFRLTADIRKFHPRTTQHEASIWLLQPGSLSFDTRRTLRNLQLAPTVHVCVSFTFIIYKKELSKTAGIVYQLYNYHYFPSTFKAQWQLYAPPALILMSIFPIWVYLWNLSLFRMNNSYFPKQHWLVYEWTQHFVRFDILTAVLIISCGM